MFQATRRRLAIWYTSVTAVLLLLFVSGFYFYVRQTLVERVDDTLNHVVEVVERSLVIEPLAQVGDNPPTRVDWSTLHGLEMALQVNIEDSFRNNATATDDDRIDLEWFSPRGELYWSTFSEPLNLPLHPNRHETVRVNPPASGGPELLLRQVTDRVQIGRQVLGYLRVSHPWFEVTKPSRQLMVDLALGLILTVISVAAIGWLLSGLAMAPIRDAFQRLKQFTADASHELRNPIATIQTNVQVTLTDPDLNPQERQQLQVIERITRRLGRLVEDLLFLARQDSNLVLPEFKEVPLDALLVEVIEEQTAMAIAQGIDLTLDLSRENGDSFGVGAAGLEIDPEAFTIAGDWHQLIRLLTNVISNGIHYTPPGGQVNVCLQSGIKPKRPPLRPGVQITVRDTGIGIPPEALPQIFDRFYQVDPARSRAETPGSGLGLAIARAIVERHQGYIQIESEINLGTTLTIFLPQNPVKSILRN
ncbi:MAG: sensor histidine kinase [Oscillatoriales cyanobacterium RM2_1_1]|nr:sensor histidine kinase [Oscillatoriales cyanobacterium SM2_3_0]NJO45114.1 sensor histidine kinase [Oscillatoriales cyanobacterium RM2_1_1]